MQDQDDPAEHGHRVRLAPPKLRIPVTTIVPVQRNRLLNALDDHTASTRRPPPVTVVCGPAGSGKTTLLATWARLNVGRTATAWVTLDVHDNEPFHLWSAIREALLESGAWGEDRRLRRLPRARSSVKPGFLAAVITAFDHLAAPVCLILDDAHELRERAALDGIEMLMRHCPDNLRLVLVARTLPSLHLSRLRVEDRLREIRNQELAFTRDEAESLLGSHHLRLAPEDVDLLLRRTEGWAAGLRLAVMSLTSSPAQPQNLMAFPGDDRTVADYLVEEILDQHPDHIRQFLLSTSICETISPGLATALSKQRNSGEILDRLERANSLLTRLDRPGQWYRFHPILRGYLCTELARRQPCARRHLCHAAAEWFRDSGDSLAALEYAIRAEDGALSEDLVEAFGLREILRGNGNRLHELLGTLPDDVLARPYIAAIATIAAWDVPRPPRADHLRIWRATVVLHRAHGVVSPDGRSGDTDLDVLALLSRGIATLGRGDHLVAEEHLMRALDLATQEELDCATLQCLVHLSAVAAARSDLTQMDERAVCAVQFATERGWEKTSNCALAYVFMGTQAHQRLDTARARQFSALAMELLPPGTDPTATLAALSLDAIVEFDDARNPHEVVETMRNRWRCLGDGHVAPSLLAYVAPNAQRMYLRVGELGWAVDVAEQAESILGHCGEHALLQAVLQLHKGRAGQARKLVEPVLHGEIHTIVATTVVEAWLLEAVLVDREGDRHRAHEAISRALAAAEPMCAIRPFHDAGGPVRDLLASGAGRFGRMERFATTTLTALPTHSATSADLLTNRELDLLVELPSMRTAEEIAEGLFVSVNTVKTHLRGIYRKLGVNQRRDAVTVARQRGLL